LEGDHLGFNFAGFEPPFADNLVYSSHLYPAAAVKEGVYPGIIDGEMWDKEKLRQAFIQSEGVAFSQKYNVPLWVGEFGTSYIHAEERDSRGRVLSDLIEVFEEYGAHWTVWTYKDIGNMGLLQVNPGSDYAAKVLPLLDVENQFSRDSGQGRKKVAELADYMQSIAGDPDIDRNLNRYLLEMSVRENYLQNLIVPSYVKLFENLSFEEIDDTLKAFSVDRCVRHPALEVMKKFLSAR
jgi:endoglucanase